MKADFVELWRRHTLAYAPIRRIIGDRVYPRHISGVAGAKFPALSIFALSAPISLNIVSGQYQMDSWSHNDEEARHLQDYLEDIWTPENIEALPKDAGVQVLFIRQANRVDVGFEDDAKLFHKAGIYVIKWKAL